MAFVYFVFCVFNKPTDHFSIEMLYNDKTQAIF